MTSYFFLWRNNAKTGEESGGDGICNSSFSVCFPFVVQNVLQNNTQIYLRYSPVNTSGYSEPVQVDSAYLKNVFQYYVFSERKLTQNVTLS